MERRASRQEFLPHVVVILGCLVLGSLVTYPLIGRIATHLAERAENHDPAVFAWNNWWIHHALVDLHFHKPYFSEHILVPFPLDLRLHTLGLLYGLLSLPLFSFLGPIAIVNLQILVTPALNGYSVFLLARNIARRNDVAAVCGLAIATTPAIDYHFGLGRPGCAAFWTIALGLLFLMRLIEEPRWRNALGLAASVVALLLADQQLTIFGGLVFSLYLIWAAVANPKAFLDRRLWAYAGVVLAIVAYPFRVYCVRPFFQTPGYTTPDPSEALVYSVPLSMLLTPAHAWRLYGAVLPLGLLASLFVVRAEPRARFWVVLAFACLSLTLGPVLQGTSFPLPFAALRKLPGMSQFRAPYRFQTPAALGMALALALTLAAHLARMERQDARGRQRARWLVGALLLVIAGDTVAYRAVRGFPTHTVPDEPVYRTIAAMPGDFLVLEVPFGVRSGTDVIGRGDDLMFYQTVHGKRMINGYFTRVPLVALDYYRKSPALLFFGDERYSAAGLAADFDAKLRALNVGVIVVHPDMLSAERLTAALAFLRARPDLVPFPTGSALLAFRVVTSGA